MPLVGIKAELTVGTFAVPVTTAVIVAFEPIAHTPFSTIWPVAGVAQELTYKISDPAMPLAAVI